MFKKILIMLVIPALLSGITSAQNEVVQPEHEHKVYVDKEKARVYVWKTGLYLFVGTENDERAFKYQLINSDSAGSDTVSPFYLDMEGLNTVIEPNPKNRKISKDKLSEFKIYADWSAPKTTVSENVDKMVRVEKREIRGEPFDIALSSDDNAKIGSGTAAVYYSLNDREYVKYASPYTIYREGLYTFRYYSVDHVGNVEKSITKYYGLDLTPPVTRHKVISGNVGDILSPRAVLNLISNDEMAGVKATYFSLDGDKEHKYGKTISLEKVTEGEHVLSYHSIDKIDNSEVVNEYPFYLDRTPPVSSIKVDRDMYQDGTASYVSERSKFTLTAYDAKVDVRNIYYNVNNGSNQIFDSPFALTTSAVNHKIQFWADDVLLNTAKPETQDFVLDIHPPTVFHDFDGPHFNARNINYINSSTQIFFKTADNLSGVQSVAYQINGGEEKDGSAHFTLDQPGPFTLSYNATDNVNNLSPSKSTELYVDNGNPNLDFEFGVKNLNGETVKIASNEGNNVFPEKVFLYLYGTDDHSGIKSIRYTINGGPERIYSGALVFDTPGQFSIDVTVIDNVDNTAGSNVSFEITAQ